MWAKPVESLALALQTRPQEEAFQIKGEPFPSDSVHSGCHCSKFRDEMHLAVYPRQN